LDILKLIDKARALNASDLHLVAYSPPLMRINGNLQNAEAASLLTENEVNEAFYQIADWKQIEEFRRELELDFSYALPDGARLRCNVAQQRGLISMAIRILQPEIPTIEALQLPEVYKKLALLEKGLVVVSGPTGSGKTTTLNAMVEYMNTHVTRHIFTIEDPIEYFHANLKSKITQRELGGDTHSMAQALKHVLRHDPDVIIVGEMRDAETAGAVISMAETGHLVVTTGHAPYAPQTVERIIDLFPADERYLVQMRIASLLSAVLCQTLVPRASSPGRIAAVEIMLVNSAIRNLIREGRITLLSNAMRTYRDSGSITIDEALVDLYSRGVITMDTVTTFCHEPEEVKKLVSEWMTNTKNLIYKR